MLGSVVFSRGFQEKVTNNPVMSGDSRNQGIILASDGIPYFKDKGTNRSGYPCGARLANPPEQIGKSLGLTHLTMSSGSILLLLRVYSRLLRSKLWSKQEYTLMKSILLIINNVNSVLVIVYSGVYYLYSRVYSISGKSILCRVKSKVSTPESKRSKQFTPE